jgi:hypothetical protein
VTELHIKNGDLDLEKQNLADKLQQTQAELEKARSHDSSESTHELPEAGDLLNQLKGKFPKTKISLREVEAILELL